MSCFSPSARKDGVVNPNDMAVRAENVLGYSFNNPDLLLTCLTHSSFAASRVDSNERLEFLGDAVLGMVVCTELYRRYSDWLEGDLTKVKSVIVSRRVCAKIADSMGLADLLILGTVSIDEVRCRRHCARLY